MHRQWPSEHLSAAAAAAAAVQVNCQLAVGVGGWSTLLSCGGLACAGAERGERGKEIGRRVRREREEEGKRGLERR